MPQLKIIQFDDIVFTPHTMIPGGVQARVDFEDGSFVSIVGGPTGVYGDGKTTFEVWYSDDEDPRGWQSIEDINIEFARRSLPWNGMI
jgi:hypothetical protein